MNEIYRKIKDIEPELLGSGWSIGFTDGKNELYLTLENERGLARVYAFEIERDVYFCLYKIFKRDGSMDAGLKKCKISEVKIQITRFVFDTVYHDLQENQEMVD